MKVPSITANSTRHLVSGDFFSTLDFVLRGQGDIVFFHVRVHSLDMIFVVFVQLPKDVVHWCFSIGVHELFFICCDAIAIMTFPRLFVQYEKKDRFVAKQTGDSNGGLKTY